MVFNPINPFDINSIIHGGLVPTIEGSVEVVVINIIMAALMYISPRTQDKPRIKDLITSSMFLLDDIYLEIEIN